jgi:hypothetical protein
MQSEFKKYLLTGLVVVGFLGNVSGLIVKTDILQSPDGKKTVYLYSDIHTLGTEQEKAEQFDYIKTSLEKCDPKETVVLLEGHQSKEDYQKIEATISLIEQFRDRESDIESIDPKLSQLLRNTYNFYEKGDVIPGLSQLSFSETLPFMQRCDMRFISQVYILAKIFIELGDSISFDIDSILTDETLESICQQICAATEMLEQCAANISSGRLKNCIEDLLDRSAERIEFAQYFIQGDLEKATEAIKIACKATSEPIDHSDCPFYEVHQGDVNPEIFHKILNYKNTSLLSIAEEDAEFFQMYIFPLIEIITYYFSPQSESFCFPENKRLVPRSLGTLDLIMLGNILQDNEKSTIVVFAGLAHIERIKVMLSPKSTGYKTIYSSPIFVKDSEETFKGEDILWIKSESERMSLYSKIVPISPKDFDLFSSPFSEFEIGGVE